MPKAPTPSRTSTSVILVPDTSVLVDGRITELLAGKHRGSSVVVPRAALAELESQANSGHETGFTGLNELEALQRLAAEGKCTVTIAGRKPTVEEIERARSGAIDSLIRETATEAEGTLVTSDRVQAHAAGAEGIDHIYLPPLVEEPDLSALSISEYFDEDTMSVHLKADCAPMAKRGRPGSVEYTAIRDEPTPHGFVRKVARECIEFAKRDYQSFVELQRHGCTVLQVGNMRITIAQPPFSDGLEITAVRPVFKADLEGYELPDAVLERLEGRARGVFIAGPPGHGKSTFAAAAATHLHGLQRVVKTMEAPRDLQVPKEITQYAPLDQDMTSTGEVMLLVRTDHVVYDEVRTTKDFQVFADMRLAGIGLLGVTHANRAIDAVQRLLGRVDLGMIPQVVDTVVFIENGRIAQILEISFTVRVPAGMTQEDLSRPVVVVKDFETGREVYELYTYGEQIVVMPLEGEGAVTRGATGAGSLAGKELQRSLRRYVRGPLEVAVRGNLAQVYVDDAEVPTLIGKGGRTVQGLEKRFGIRLDIRPLSTFRGPSTPGGGRVSPRRRKDSAHDGPSRDEVAAGSGHVDLSAGPGEARVRRTGGNIFVILDDFESGETYEVYVEDALVGEATMARNGRLRFKLQSPAGKALDEAVKSGLTVSARPLEM